MNDVHITVTLAEDTHLDRAQALIAGSLVTNPMIVADTVTVETLTDADDPTIKCISCSYDWDATVDEEMYSDDAYDLLCGHASEAGIVQLLDRFSIRVTETYAEHR